MADEASSKAEESVPTPQPHDRSRPDPDDEEDPVDKMIKDTGCLELHYAVQVNESGWADDAMAIVRPDGLAWLPVWVWWVWWVWSGVGGSQLIYVKNFQDVYLQGKFITMPWYNILKSKYSTFI